MKRCPACNSTYADDGLSFCLEDGTALQLTAGNLDHTLIGDTDSDPSKTLAYGAPRETVPPPIVAQPPPPYQIPQVQPTWSPSYPPAHSAQPSRKSGKGIVIVAVAALAFIGIGIIVLLTIIGRNSSATQTNSNGATTNGNNNSVVVSTNANNNSNDNSSPAGYLKDDFSTENWPTGEGAYGSFYQDGEYHMAGKPGLYVFMFPRNSSAYRSENATVKVTARNVDGKAPNGYGLVIHGKMNSARQLEGYGFLIYTGATPKFEIVRFVAGTPTPLVNWRDSSVIRSGTLSNQIEVRSAGSNLSFYINGQYVESITDTAGVTSGYIGLYTTEPNEVTFDDMEIQR